MNDDFDIEKDLLALPWAEPSQSLDALVLQRIQDRKPDRSRKRLLVLLTLILGLSGLVAALTIKTSEDAAPPLAPPAPPRMIRPEAPAKAPAPEETPPLELLGLTLTHTPDALRGPLELEDGWQVTAIEPKSWADGAGLQFLDVLVGPPLEKRAIDEAGRALKDLIGGRSTELALYRRGQRLRFAPPEKAPAKGPPEPELPSSPEWPEPRPQPKPAPLPPQPKPKAPPPSLAERKPEPGPKPGLLGSIDMNWHAQDGSRTLQLRRRAGAMSLTIREGQSIEYEGPLEAAALKNLSPKAKELLRRTLRQTGDRALIQRLQKILADQ